MLPVGSSVLVLCSHIVRNAFLGFHQTILNILLQVESAPPAATADSSATSSKSASADLDAELASLGKANIESMRFLSVGMVCKQVVAMQCILHLTA